MKTLIVTVAAVLALAGAANAQMPDSVVVKHRGLDLATEAGRNALQARVAAAIEKVCGTYDVRDVRGRAVVMACRAETTAATEVQVARIIASHPSRLAVRAR